MKFGIYGVNRVAKDFIYIFEDIEVVLFFDDDSCIDSFEGRKVKSTTSILEAISNGVIDQLIICDFDKGEKEKKTKQLGLIYGKDYLYESDFFLKFDTYSLNEQKKPLIAWGVGRRTTKLATYYGLENIEFFIDSKKPGNHYASTGIPIYYPQEVDLSKYFIIITVGACKDIISNLESQGLKHFKDFCTMGELLTQPSWMIKKTIFDTKCYDVECRTLFNHAELNQQGLLQCCCVPFVIGEMGSVEKNTIDEIWNGIVHKLMCLATNNRTYSFCNPDMCPIFIDRKSDADFDISREYLKMESRPRNLLVNFEDSCNLYCESCRNEIKVAHGKELEKNLKYADILIKDVLPYTEFVTMAGTGEVFVGKGYEKMYMSNSMNNVKWIRLLSNGMLFNKKNWEKISANKIAKFILTVSVDAATKETYEIVRRGGNFDILKKNMEFASMLRKEGKLSYFRLNFVVQRKNYKEIPLFVQWGLDLGADEVFFTKILNYGTYSQEEFIHDVSMMESDGMTPREELKEILDMPIMHEKIVNLGTIRYANEAIGLDEIENYYRWELERKVPNLFSE